MRYFELYAGIAMVIMVFSGIAALLPRINAPAMLISGHLDEHIMQIGWTGLIITGIAGAFLGTITLVHVWHYDPIRDNL